MSRAGAVKLYIQYCPNVKRLNGHNAGMLFDAVMGYANGGARISFTPNKSGTPAAVKAAALMNALYNAMCDDIDADRGTFADRKQGRIDGAVDGVVFDGEMVRGVHKWVWIYKDDYIGLVLSWGERTVNHYIQFVDRAAQKTGNANNWDQWEKVLSVAMECEWDADFQHSKPSCSGDYRAAQEIYEKARREYCVN